MSGTGQKGPGEDRAMDRYIHEQNLALLSKRLAETHDDAQRKVILKLLAEEEAKGMAGPPKSEPR
jgi:hypothetical protein